MMMKPSCSWCKDYEQFEENKQLSILVNCYKKLCEYITQTTLARDIIEAVDCSSDILALLNDGSLFCEETEKPSDSSFTLCLTHSPLPSTSEPTTDPQASLSPMSESTLSIAIGSSVINGLPTYNGLSIDRFGINIPSPEHSNTIDVCNTVDIKT
ncbi:MSL2 isoform 3, partial [Pan troglodytes]